SFAAAPAEQLHRGVHCGGQPPYEIHGSRESDEPWTQTDAAIRPAVEVAGSFQRLDQPQRGRLGKLGHFDELAHRSRWVLFIEECEKRKSAMDAPNAISVLGRHCFHSRTKVLPAMDLGALPRSMIELLARRSSSASSRPMSLSTVTVSAPAARPSHRTLLGASTNLGTTPGTRSSPTPPGPINRRIMSRVWYWGSATTSAML